MEITTTTVPRIGLFSLWKPTKEIHEIKKVEIKSQLLNNYPYIFDQTNLRILQQLDTKQVPSPSGLSLLIKSKRISIPVRNSE